jgi:hypothetical protein
MDSATAAGLGESVPHPSPAATAIVKVSLSFNDPAVSTNIAEAMGRTVLQPFPAVPATSVESGSAGLMKAAATAIGGRESTESWALPAPGATETMEMATARKVALSTDCAAGSREGWLAVRAALYDSAAMGSTQEATMAAAVAAGAEGSVTSGRISSTTAVCLADFEAAISTVKNVLI